jgi:autotransporter-associated beta strand protein
MRALRTTSLLLLALGAAPSVPAVTWDGGGAGALWSTAANWAGDTNPPATGENFIFSGVAQKVNTNDLVTSSGWLHLPTAGYALYGTGAGATMTLGGNITNFGAGNLIDINLTLGATRTILVTNGGSLEISGDIGGTGGLTLVGRNHRLTLSGNNTFAGNVTVNSGLLVVRNSSSLGAGTKNIVMTAGTAGNPQMLLDGTDGDIDLPANLSFQTSNNNGSLFNAAGNNTIRGNFTLTSGGGDTWISVTNGSLTLMGTFTPNTTARALRLDGTTEGYHLGTIANGTGANSLQLRKLGSGTWTIAGTNTYTRDTSVEAGRLILGATGSIRNTTNINVFAGAILDVSALAGGFTSTAHQVLLGAGVITGDVTTVDGTRLVPGSNGTAGTLSFSNALTLTSLTTNLFDLSSSPASGNDLVTVGNGLTAGGVIRITTIAGPLDTANPYRLFDYGGALTGAFSGIEILGSRYTGAIDTDTVAQVNATFAGAPLDLVWAGGAATWDIDTTVGWNGNTEKFLIPDNVRFDDSASGNYTVTLAGNLYPSSLIVSGSTDYAFTGAGAIQGATSLVKDGPSTLTLGTANGYTGGTIVQGGTVKLGAAAGLPNNTTVIVDDGAIFDFNGLAPGTARTNTFVIAGDGGDGLGAIRDSLATSIAGNSGIHSLVLSNNATIGTDGRFDIGLGGAAGSRLDGNGYVLTKTGTGTNDIRVQFITNVQTIAIDAGTLRYENFSHTDAGSAGATNVVAAAATLEGWGNLTLNMPVVLNGGLLRSGSGAQTWTGDIRLAADSTVGTSAGNITLDGIVSGPGALTKTNGNTLLLGGANTFDGAVWVANGNLQISHDTALGSTAAHTTIMGGNGTGGYALNLASNITVTGESLTLNGAATGRAYLRSISGTNTWAGPILLHGDVNSVGLVSEANNLLVITGDVSGITTNGAFTFIRGNGQGQILGSFVVTGGVSKTEDNLWTIGAPGGTYDWTSMSVARGTLRMGAANVMPAVRPVLMGEASTTTARFDLNGFDQTIAGLQTNAGLAAAANAVVTNGGAPATLTISNWTDYSYNRMIRDGGPGSELHIVKEGAGTQTFSGTNDYHGITTIREGLLVFGNPRAASGTTLSNLLSGGVAFDGGTAFLLGGLAGSVDLALTNLAGTGITLTAGNNGDNTVYHGVLSGPGGFGKTGAGTLELSAIQAYAGPTMVSNGTLRLTGGDNALPVGTTLTMAGPGILDLGANSQTVAGLGSINGSAASIVGSSTFAVIGDTDVSIGGTANNTQQTLIASNLSTFVASLPANRFNIGGTLTGGGVSTGTFVFANTTVITAGTVTVAGIAPGPNDTRNIGVALLGQTNRIAAGTILVGNQKNYGEVFFQDGLADAFLEIRGTNATGRADLTIGVANSGLKNGEGYVILTNGTVDARLGTVIIGQNLANSTSGTGMFSMASGVVDATSLILGQRVTVNTAAGSPMGWFQQNGGMVLANTVTIGDRMDASAAASVNGEYQLRGGTLQVGTIQAGGGSGNVTRRFAWDAGTIRNYDTSTDLSISGVGVTLNDAGHHVVEIDAGRTGTVTAAMTGDGNLVKAGAGLLSLDGATSYTGPTSVSNGTLRVNGAYSGGGLITVHNGGTLQGNGSVAGITVESGGTLAPGASPGTLSAGGAVTLELASTLAVEINGTTAGTDYDQLAMGGFGLTLNNPGLAVSLGFTPGLGDSFPIVTGLSGFDPDVFGVFSGKPQGSQFTVGSTTFEIDYGTSDISLTVVPEPSTLGLFGLLAAAVLLRRRRAI